MSVNWERIQDKLLQLKLEVTKEAKRVLKVKVPKSELIQVEVRDRLLLRYNSFIEIIVKTHETLSKEEFYIAKKLFTSIRDTVIRAYQVLGVRYKVPASCFEPIDVTIKDEFVDIEEDSAEPTQNFDMAMTKMEFFNFASKILPHEFDGTPDKARSFLDALTLLEANSEGHERNAVAYVRTKLTGKARDVIADNDSLGEIIDKIKTNIKTEGSHFVTAKLLALKQSGRDSAKYAADVDALATSLKRAYITEGVPVGVAETYSTNAVVNALKKNSNSSKVQLVMEAGTFATTQAALTKFISVSADENTSTVLYANNLRGHGGRGRYFNNRHNFHQNFNNQQRQYNGQRRMDAGRTYNSNPHRGFNNRGHRRGRNSYVRSYESETGNQGNSQEPQSGPLGAF